MGVTSVGDWDDTMISAFFLFVTAFLEVGVLGLDVLGWGCLAGFGADVARGVGLTFSADFDFSIGLDFSADFTEDGLLVTGEAEII